MTHADNGDAVEANASAASQQAEKQAQQTAVLRFMALHELLGDTLAEVGSCVADRPDLATPLGLIRGLGAEVGVTGLAGERLDALQSLYRIPAAQGDAPASADLVLASADSDPESLLEAMAEGALLAIHVDMGGGAKAMAASAARLNAIAGKIASRSDIEGLAARNLYRDRWIVMRKTSGAHGGAALEIMARRAGQAGAARAASFFERRVQSSSRSLDSNLIPNQVITGMMALATKPKRWRRRGMCCRLGMRCRLRRRGGGTVASSSCAKRAHCFWK